MNKTILRGKWRRWQGNLKSEWGRLTANDRRALDGKIDQMVGVFQERYGYSQERAAQAVKHYLGKYGAKQVPAPRVWQRPWLPLAALSALLGLMTVGWFVMKQLGQTTADFADDIAVDEADEVEAAYEEALFAAKTK